jgi:hypothetical protein
MSMSRAFAAAVEGDGCGRWERLGPRRLGGRGDRVASVHQSLIGWRCVQQCTCGGTHADGLCGSRIGRRTDRPIAGVATVSRSRMPRTPPRRARRWRLKPPALMMKAATTVSSLTSARQSQAAHACSPSASATSTPTAGVDGSDIESFFLSWEAGEEIADVNGDGGVDGGDVEVWFTRGPWGVEVSQIRRALLGGGRLVPWRSQYRPFRARISERPLPVARAARLPAAVQRSAACRRLFNRVPTAPAFARLDLRATNVLE